MTSHQEKSYKAGETRGKTQEKTGEAMGMMREKTEAAKDKTQGAGRSTQPMKQLNQLKTRHLKAHKQLNRKLKTPRTKREATSGKDKTGGFMGHMVSK
ncbi:unnamed protein product [Brassica rapa subsp. narinosa]|uniref:(rape) hypothetical protein n=1 Tax=Brassica napus TaxID=3708 RepID=A0A816ZI29_BRANA|nr:unnamed protein product [Brassica napus]